MKTVVIYDGLCGLCTQSMRLIRRLDWRHALEYLDAQAWDMVHARYPQLDPEAILGAIHVVTPENRVYVGYEAMRRLARELPPVMWLYPLLFIPGITWLGPRVYAWIAAHRYQFNRLFGVPVCEGGACKIHQAANAPKSGG